MKIFVTGGGGFIGYHLVNSLLKNNNSVTVYDSFTTNENKMLHLKKLGVSIIQGDVTNYELLLKSIDGFDSVIHLAARVNVEESIKAPELIHNVNVTGTVNLLRVCVKQHIQNIIAASSASVYGASKDLPLTENSRTIPISPYGASKLAMEHYMQAFSHSYDLNCISLRFFNIYGKGQSSKYGGVIKKLMEKIEGNMPLEIIGDGTNTRDFVAIEDIISSIQNAMEKIEDKKGNFYNIGSGKPTSINEIAKLMLSISGKDLPITHKESKKGDISHSQASISLAKKDLGYFPKITLKEGLTKLLEPLIN